MTAAAWESRAQTNREISTFQQYYDLSNEELNRGRSLRLKASVLCYDSSWNQLYLHDGNQTFYFDPKVFRTQPERGQRVEITGLASRVDGQRALTKLDLRILGRAPLPPAKRLELPQLGREYGEWIETVARVRVADTSSGRLALSLHSQGQSCLAYVMGAPRTNDFKWLFGAEVRVSGINGSKIVNGRLESAEIMVPDFDDITILNRSDRSPWLVPVVSVGSLLSRELGSWTNDLVHLNGVISGYRPKEYLIVKDASGLIRAQVIQVSPARTDDRVNVWGYLDASSAGIVLKDAFFEVVPPLSRPAAPMVAPGADSTEMVAPEVLTRISDIRMLPRSLAARRIPVRLECVVTYADAEWRTCFVQDQTGGIYVDASSQDVLAGQWVEMTGRTAPGGYAPMVIDPVFRVLGSTNMPAPAQVELEDLAAGHQDSQWVEMQGVVRRLFDEWGHVYLTIMTSQGKFKALIPGPQNAPPPSHLIDALVSVQGACTSETNRMGQLTGIILNVPSLNYVKILEQPADDPFSVDTIPIASVATFQLERLAGRRVKVGGTVTWETLGQGFYLQDASGGIRVQTQQTNEIRLGDRVEVLGFPALGDFSPQLDDAVFRRTGSDPPPLPVRTTAEQILLHGTNDAVVVEIEAQLLQDVSNAAQPRLVLQDGPIIFTASMGQPRRSQDARAWAVGSRLRLTGVCAIQGGESRAPKAFGLLLRGPGDLRVLSRPPWWTPRHTVMLASGMALAIGLALAWVALLRRTVRRQTEVIRRDLEIEEALEQRYRELFENASDLLFTFDLAGRCTSLNRAAERFFAMSRAEALEKSLVDFVTPEYRAVVEQRVRQVLSDQGVVQLDLKANRNDGAAPLLELSLRIIRQGGQPIGLQAAARDVTERRELEDQLRQAQKMESIGQLAAGVAHDFNNLLTVILGRCDLLLMDRVNSAPHHDSIREINSAAERAANLTRQLLMFSRKQALRRKPLDLNELVANFVKMLQRLLGENIQLECAYRPELPAVFADVGMIEQVVVNLAVNARDAMPSGGRLTIRTDVVNIDSDFVRTHPESRPGLFVTLSVEDSGHGMDEATMKHLFEPFFTTKEVGKGTGLGLASVYGVVKQHQGWVQAVSQPQAGSRFTVFLPVSDQRDHRIVAEPSVDVPRGTETILIVEDEPALRSLIESFLKDCGYRVLTAASGQEAIPVWDKHKSEIDLLLTDLVMPGGITGGQLAQRLSSEKPALKTIFTSGYSVELLKGDCPLDEAMNFLAKPFVPADLAKLVRQRLDRPNHPRSAVADRNRSHKNR